MRERPGLTRMDVARDVGLRHFRVGERGACCRVARVGEECRAAREEDLPALESILAWAFAAPDPGPWLRQAGLERVRVLARDGALASCLVLFPMGQFFGGRAVDMVGVSGVAVAPEARGSGAARALLRHTIEELAASGTALSALYPTTRKLYRSVGYEPAGTYSEVRVPARELRGDTTTPPVRTLAAEDEPAVQSLYREHASRLAGHLDRGPYVWGRVQEPREGPARGFVVGERGNVEGYAFFCQKPTQRRLRYDLIVTDLAARSERAFLRLFSLLAHHGTLAEAVGLRTGPGDPVMQLLPDCHFEAGPLHQWMVRIVDLPAALAARGYGARDARLELDVRDPLLTRNAGRWLLSIRGGRASVERGGTGKLSVDVRGLAPLYTGHAPASTLAAAGLLAGDDATLATADAVFEGRAPWTPDFF